MIQKTCYANIKQKHCTCKGEEISLLLNVNLKIMDSKGKQCINYRISGLVSKWQNIMSM